MAYIVTPDLGLELADPATVQPFETPNVNSNFLKLEAGIVADRVRLAAIEGNLKRVADLDALAALSLSGVQPGTVVEVGELRALFMRNFAETAWEQVTEARFATAAARDTAYAKAAAAFRVQGARARLTDTDSVWAYFSAYNVSTNKGGALAAGWYPCAGNAYAAYFGLQKADVTTSVNMELTATKDIFGLVDETTERVTVQVAGLYRIHAVRGHSGTTANSLSLVRSGTTVAVGALVGASGASSSGSVDTVVALAVGDYVEFKISAAAATTFSASLARGSVEFFGVRTV